MAALVGRPGAPVPVRGTTVESARVEAGIPRFGVDFDEQTFPQEAGLDSVVSYEKGCYLGQEIVARIHFRGGVNRVLRSLEFDRGTEVSPGDKLVSGDETIGEITSVAGPGSNRALGSVTVSAAECDGTLTLEGGAAVRLVALPFRTG